MANIKVISEQQNVKVRVGQQNAVRITSSVAGSDAFSEISGNVIGGIASVTQLYVSGISTLGTTYITSDLSVSRNLQVSGLSTFTGLLDANGGAAIDNIQIGVSNNNEIDTSTGNLVLDSAGGTVLIDDQLNVTGIASFSSDVYIGGVVNFSNLLVTDLLSSNANISGILTVGTSLYYPAGQPYGVAYFDQNDLLVSTGSTSSAISETNYILSTDSSGIPTWSNVIDGGSY